MKKKTSETVIVEGRFYTIASPNGRVLEVANYNPESGAAIQLWDYAGAQWQQWTFVPVGADTYRICNRFTGKAIDLCLGGTADGTWLHQWDCNTGRAQIWSDNEGTNQRWILKDVTDKNAIRPSAAQLEKRVKEQVEEAAQEAAKAAKKAARKAPAKKSAAKTTATRTCRAKKTAETSAAETAAKPRRTRKSTSKSDETT